MFQLLALRFRSASGNREVGQRQSRSSLRKLLHTGIGQIPVLVSRISIPGKHSNQGDYAIRDNQFID